MIRGSRDLSYPPELIAEIEERFGPYPLYHSKVYTPSSVRELLDECRAILDYRVKTALYLMESRDWDVLMIYLEGTDRVQHELWHVLDETHPRHDPAEAGRYRQNILDFCRETDAQARRFVQAAGPGTNVIVMSDHGFGPIHRFVNLNIWLWRQGFLALKGVWGMLFLFLVVMGGIYTGVFTPTEAAGIGAFGAFIFSLFKKQMNWAHFVDSLRMTAQTTAMIFIIVIGAHIFGYFLAVTRIPSELADYMANIHS